AHLRRKQPSPKPPPSGRGLPHFTSLVPNERGMQGVLDVNARAGFKLIDKIAVFTAASETFSRKNTNASSAESIGRFRPVVEIAHRAGMEIRAYISCVIACPFEGPIRPERVNEVARQLLELGIDDLDLGDTIGAGTPRQTHEVVKRALDALPVEAVAMHMHDTRGTALANVVVGLELGVRNFDASVGGLGGCPYAPGAAGNVATEDLVYMLEGMGVETGIDLERLVEAARAAESIVGRPLPGKVHRAGIRSLRA
ncbi:MAG: hydroxymethylglutaryl-CoA lyase, partial [Labilithrix sp.]|nr:hydroxymethylglutaryl-CoA lyase [Labilithrix sp.]